MGLNSKLAGVGLLPGDVDMELDDGDSIAVNVADHCCC